MVTTRSSKVTQPNDAGKKGSKVERSAQNGLNSASKTKANSKLSKMSSAKQNSSNTPRKSTLTKGIIVSKKKDDNSNADNSMQKRKDKEDNGKIGNSDLSHIRSTMYELISHTQPSSTICPSQIPRRLHDLHPGDYPDWRSMMDQTREVVWSEVRLGHVEVTQGGVVREYGRRGDIVGPIRVRRGVRWDER